MSLVHVNNPNIDNNLQIFQKNNFITLLIQTRINYIKQKISLENQSTYQHKWRS